MAVFLGISPSTRLLGLAILDRGELTKWETYPFPQKWSQDKLERIIHVINKYIDHNSISGIAIKVPDDLPITESYIRLIGAINVLCEQKQFLPVYYSLSDIKKLITPHAKVNKEGLMYYITEHYPEVRYLYEKEQSIKNPYHYRTLEAIAVTHCLKHSYLLH